MSAGIQSEGNQSTGSAAIAALDWHVTFLFGARIIEIVLGVSRYELVERRAELVGCRTGLVESRTGLVESRTRLAESRNVAQAVQKMYKKCPRAGTKQKTIINTCM